MIRALNEYFFDVHNTYKNAYTHQLSVLLPHALQYLFSAKKLKKNHTHNLRRRSLKQGKLPSAKKKIYIYYSFTIVSFKLSNLN